MSRNSKLIPVGTSVIDNPKRGGSKIKGTVIDAFHISGMIRYQIIKSLMIETV